MDAVRAENKDIAGKIQLVINCISVDLFWNILKGVTEFVRFLNKLMSYLGFLHVPLERARVPPVIVE